MAADRYFSGAHNTEDVNEDGDDGGGDENDGVSEWNTCPFYTWRRRHLECLCGARIEFQSICRLSYSPTYLFRIGEFAERRWCVVILDVYTSIVLVQGVIIRYSALSHNNNTTQICMYSISRFKRDRCLFRILSDLINIYIKNVFNSDCYGRDGSSVYSGIMCVDYKSVTIVVVKNSNEEEERNIAIGKNADLTLFNLKLCKRRSRRTKVQQKMCITRMALLKQK